MKRDYLEWLVFDQFKPNSVEEIEQVAHILGDIQQRGKTTPVSYAPKVMA